jgi:hypothetical protein
MNISIDFDDTYTRDFELWDLFVEAAQARGHTVYCVTARGRRGIDETEVLDTIGRLIGPDRCIFSDGKPKQNFCWSQGILIDVWCDDMPEAIIKGRKLFDYDDEF